MEKINFFLDTEEYKILQEVNNNEWVETPLSLEEKKMYKQHAEYTLSLHEKKVTPIELTISELAFLKAKSVEVNLKIQDIVQALVRNYAAGKIRLEL